MAQMGRPPKPTELKRALGNPGKRPLPEPSQYLQPAQGIPKPQRPLAKSGKALWSNVWTSGAGWISPHIDSTLLLMTCEMLDERDDLRIKVATEGEPRDRRGLRELEKLIINNLSLMGFSPADRTRLGLAEVRAQSKLAELMAKRDDL
jgi:hypothetical protein